MSFKSWLGENESIRSGYQKLGSDEFYRQFGGGYENPHEPIIRVILQCVVDEWNLDTNSVLDLAAGGGEVTAALKELGVSNIDATDPFTHELYQNRTGEKSHKYSFQDIANDQSNKLKNYSLIVCSFAMHLLDESWLPSLLYSLSRMGEKMLIISPHKRPPVKEEWGWEKEKEMTYQRVHARLYKSIGRM